MNFALAPFHNIKMSQRNVIYTQTSNVFVLLSDTRVRSETMTNGHPVDTLAQVTTSKHLY